MNNRLIRILKYLIGWPLSAISLFFVFKLIGSNLNSLNNLKYINIPLLILSFVAFIFYFFLRTYLWQSLIKPSGNKFNYFKTSYLWEISEVKRYTPGNIWSFLSRTKIFSEDNIPKKDVGISLFNEVILIILSSFTISYFYISTYFNNALLSQILLLVNIIIITVYTLNSFIKFKFIPTENFWTNFKYYFLAVCAFFLFGLGTYFAAVSITYLDPGNILNLISLFTFALLVGYLSIITPMGLGVREGITTFGLSSQVSLPSAGIISIFSRIIFIISELIFLLFAYLLNKIKSKNLKKLVDITTNNKHLSILFLGIIIFCIYFTAASFLRYDNFYTGRFDLGNMDQTVWNTINGRIFQFTDANGTNIVSRLAYHADFILILISPFYLIWSNPKMLLLLQVIVLSLGSVFVYFLGKDITKHKNFSLTLAICYLLYPAIHYNLLFDFHGVTLATTFLLATFYFFLRKSYLLFLVFAILSGICKEQIWSIIAIFGIVIALRSFIQYKLNNKKEILFGLVCFTFSSFLFYALLWKIIPHFRGSGHFALAYFSDFGNNTSEVFANIFLRPFQTISILLKHENLIYFTQLLSPLGFLSILGFPILIFAAPDIFINALSNNQQLHQIYYQYTSVITPFIFIAAIYGAKLIVKKVKYFSFGLMALLIIISTLITQYYIGPMPGSKKASLSMFSKQLLNSNQIENFLQTIPKNYSISATNNLGSHLSRRENIYTVPVATESADYVMFLSNQGYSEIDSNTEELIIKNLIKNKNYNNIVNNSNFVVFKKIEN